MDSDVLALLACPQCKGDLTFLQEEKKALYCAKCGLYFPIIEGIPVLMLKEALGEKAWKEFQKS